ncbi:Zn-dependent hydrolase [Paraburkholderia phytofirmans]
MDIASITVDSNRLWDTLMEVAAISPGKAGGSSRQALTGGDAQVRELFRTWCESSGMTMGVDKVGNMFFTRPGLDDKALPVYMGSHLDTQPTGGRFDGVLGVLAGLEVVRTLNERRIRAKHPIVVTNWSNEEGARFAPAMLASGVFAGVHTLEYAYSRTDPDGKTYGDELKRIGWLGEEEPGSRKMHAYYEYHIEQGPILEDENKQIGVVTHNQGLWWLEFTLTGKTSHTGATPMYLRVNAGLAMARIVEMVQRVATENAPDSMGGVGQMRFFPNSRNVLPGKVVFTVDLRSPDAKKLKAMRSQVEREAAEICDRLNVSCSVEAIGHSEPVAYDPTLVSIVRKSAEQLGYSFMDIISGAGHDACWTARVAPATMIFCPCVGGVSHNEAEAISEEWAAAGANVLLHAVIESAVPVD